VTAGERWARELIAELRAARFTPRAWQRFLARSFERADDRRRERAREHRQTLALGALGLGAWSAVALVGKPWLAAAGAAWWAMTILMLDWHLGMLERRDGTPLGSIGTANLLSLARIGAVPVLPALAPRLLAAALVAAAAADVLDGLLARRRDKVSRLGFWLDGIADTLVLSAVAVLAAANGDLPAWAASLVVVRFAVPAAVMTVSYFLALNPQPASLRRARIAGVPLWIGLLVAVLGGPLGTELTTLGAVGGLAATVATAHARHVEIRGRQAARPASRTLGGRFARLPRT
jgi:phosphatidylglycerophosphate synthase